MMEDNEYQCALCGGIFQKVWSDDEANAEYAELFPDQQDEPMEVVCENCFKIMGLGDDMPEGLTRPFDMTRFKRFLRERYSSQEASVFEELVLEVVELYFKEVTSGEEESR